MKVVVAGSRTFRDYGRLERCLDLFRITEVISGAASGADVLGQRYANLNGIPLTLFHANWKEHGKAAGPIRNAEMAEVCDYAILFWDGESKGTLSMMREMVKRGKGFYVEGFSNEEN